jgi:hypothetical protein
MCNLKRPIGLLECMQSRYLSSWNSIETSDFYKHIPHSKQKDRQIKRINPKGMVRVNIHTYIAKKEHILFCKQHSDYFKKLSETDIKMLDLTDSRYS